MVSHVAFGCFAQGIASGMGTDSRGDVAALGPQLRHHSGFPNIPLAISEVELLEAAQLSKPFGQWWVRLSGSCGSGLVVTKGRWESEKGSAHLLGGTSVPWSNHLRSN